LLSWRSIIAGLVISLLFYGIMMSLGLGIGGQSLSGVIQHARGGQGLSVGAGFWLVLSNIVAVFVGAYFASRITHFFSKDRGGAQGLVVAGAFFALMVLQAGMAIGAVGSGVGSAMSSMGGAVSDVAGQPGMDKFLDQTFKNLNLKSDPKTVAAGLSSHLVRGDQDGAYKYLAQQAGISEQEAKSRIDAVANDIQASAKDAGVKAAKVASGIGWTVFTILLLGSLAGYFGGYSGAGRNVRKPLLEEEKDGQETPRAA